MRSAFAEKKMEPKEGLFNSAACATFLPDTNYYEHVRQYLSIIRGELVHNCSLHLYYIIEATLCMQNNGWRQIIIITIKM